MMENVHAKDFVSWHRLKSSIDGSKQPPTFNEREIWWASIGVNVGFEVDGKNQFFDRPVLVLRKISRYTFVGIPLTTNMKPRPTRHAFTFRNRPQNAIMDQIRLLDSRRLNNLMGQLNDNDFNQIRAEIRKTLRV